MHKDPLTRGGAQPEAGGCVRNADCLARWAASTLRERPCEQLLEQVRRVDSAARRPLFVAGAAGA